MRKGALVYIIFVLFILTGLLVYLAIEENNAIEERVEIQKQNFEIKKMQGNRILKSYRTEIELIEEGKLKIIIRDRKDNPIKYNTYEELEHIVYLTQDYKESIENILGVEYRYYTLDNYANLLTILKTSGVEIDEKKLRYYYGDEEISILKDNNSQDANVNSNTNVSRKPNANEVYGKDVITNFSGHKNDIENGIKYFKVVTNGVSKSYKDINELKLNVKDNDIYKKEFEVNANGALKGYTFTKVD